VDAAVVEEPPDHHREEKVGEHILLARLAQQDGESDDREGYEQQREIDGAAVEKGYHQNRYQVVSYRESRQEYFQRHRHFVREH
jgi:hypothetical protein